MCKTVHYNDYLCDYKVFFEDITCLDSNIKNASANQGQIKSTFNNFTCLDFKYLLLEKYSFCKNCIMKELPLAIKHSIIVPSLTDEFICLLQDLLQVSFTWLLEPG